MRQVIRMIEPDFNQLAKIHGAVNFARESSFALELLKSNSFLAGVAMGDQDSLKHAVVSVAAIGLSLSPVHKLAYLVPRGKKVCLDISYRGYVHLAIEAGSIKWAHAEVVREKDTFQLRGLGQEPIHNFEPFGDRGSVVGAYCVAKTHDGDFLTTTMTGDEILSIRDRSESWKSGKGGPWSTDEGEMIKKTVIRRAYKSWPMTDTRQRERMNVAIDVSSDFDPSEPIDANPALPDRRAESLAKIRTMLSELGRTEEKYVEHLVRVCRRDIKKLDDLTDQEISQAIIFLSSFVEAKKTKEVINEDAG